MASEKTDAVENTTTEVNAIVHYKDAAGNVVKIYPQTKAENVTDLEDNYLKKSGGTMTGTLNMDGKNIYNVSTVGNQDYLMSINSNSIQLDSPAAQIYFDAYKGVIYSDELEITSNGGLGVTINDVVTPTSDTMAANKKYVDDKVAAKSPYIIEKSSVTSSTAQNIVQQITSNIGIRDIILYDDDLDAVFNLSYTDVSTAEFYRIEKNILYTYTITQTGLSSLSSTELSSDVCVIQVGSKTQKQVFTEAKTAVDAGKAVLLQTSTNSTLKSFYTLSSITSALATFSRTNGDAIQYIQVAANSTSTSFTTTTKSTGTTIEFLDQYYAGSHDDQVCCISDGDGTILYDLVIICFASASDPTTTNHNSIVLPSGFIERIVDVMDTSYPIDIENSIFVRQSSSNYKYYIQIDTLGGGPDTYIYGITF